MATCPPWCSADHSRDSLVLDQVDERFHRLHRYSDDLVEVLAGQFDRGDLTIWLRCPAELDACRARQIAARLLNAADEIDRATGTAEH